MKYTKIYLIISLLFFTIFSAFCQNYQPDIMSPKIEQDSTSAEQYFFNEMNFTTNPHGLKDVIDGKKHNVIIIDIRSEKDFLKGHIPGAVNLPYDKYDGFEGSETIFPSLRKDSFNYIYCYELLCNLSQKACKKFASLGYPVKEVKGGFKAWQEHGYHIEK